MFGPNRAGTVSSVLPFFSFIMKHISIWEDTAPEGKNHPALSGDHTADVVVVGAGITGLTAAYLLSRAGKKVIVVEAMRVGMGTTGNSTGNLYVTVDEHLSVLRKKWSGEVAREVVRSRAAALEQIEQIVTQLAIDCDYRRCAFSFFSETGDSDIVHFIEKEDEALKAAGLKPEISENTNAPFAVRKSLSVAGQAQFHPLKYARGLAAKLSCPIYENSPVLEFDEKTGRVHTPGGSVTAKHVVMATHTPKGVYMVQTVLGPYREHGVAAELRSGACPPGIYWGLEQPKHSVRSFAANGKNYVMVIGDKYKTGQGGDTHEYVRKLEEYLRSHFDIGAVTHTWGGQQYRPADGLPYIGRHAENTYFLTGFATDGLVYGTLGAMIVSDMILNKTNDWQELYDLGRFTPVKSFKEFFMENADNFMQYLKDIPWKKDANSLMEIRPGEGKIMEHKGEKLAVYRGADGGVRVCSAVCTHMKCIVNFNPAEKTWDCPCHGSRFSVEGKVIEGPAVIDLPSKSL